MEQVADITSQKQRPPTRKDCEPFFSEAGLIPTYQGRVATWCCKCTAHEPNLAFSNVFLGLFSAL